jgi:phosphate transport system substrate-binding protein
MKSRSRFRQTASPMIRTLSALAGLLLLLAPAAGAEVNITIAGSTSLLPLAQRAAEVYMGLHPEVAISVSGRGSGDGLRFVLEGAADIAGASRNLKPREVAAAAKRGLSPHKLAVARGGVVPVVDVSNPLENITLSTLQAVYAGRIERWKELGGADKPIGVISRDSNSGTYEIFRQIVMKGERVRPDAMLMASNGTMAEAVAGNRWALGYVGLGYLNTRLKALKVNGVAPSPQGIRSGDYPLSRLLYFVTPGPPAGEVKKFMDFLTGPQGREIILAEGLIPLH